MGEKWPEKWGKIRSKNAPKSGVKNGVFFHEKYALGRGVFWEWKIEVNFLIKYLLIIFNLIMMMR